MTKEITAEWAEESGSNFNPKTGQLLIGDDKQPMDVSCVFHLEKDETDRVTAERFTGEDLDFAVRRMIELR
jgi:hypothetical protein